MNGVNPIYSTDYFQLSFNVSLSLFGPSAEDIGPWLERMNLARGVVSQKVAGITSPYYSVMGQPAGNWTAVSLFRDALLNAITDLGFEIDYSSVVFTITPRVTTTAPAPRQTPPYIPQTQSPSGAPSPESVYFDVGTDLPDVTGTPGTYVPPPLLTPEPKQGINTTWLLLGFGLLAVVILTRD